jgi:hypothetical protein
MPLVADERSEILAPRPGAGIDRRLFWLLVGLAVALRLGIFVAAAIQPIANESGLPISPFHVHGIDYNFYRDSRAFYFGEQFDDGLQRFVDAYAQFIRNFPDERTELLLAPPLLPTLYEIFDYREGHTLPLALVYLVVACVLAAFWLRWLADRGVPPVWLLLFALLPNPLWYMLNPSTDLLFAACVGGFIMLYWRQRQSPAVIVGWALFLAALVLCRPNGIVLIGFVVADLVLFRRGLSLSRSLFVLAVIVFGAAVSMYYLPYFTMVQYSSTTAQISFFGLLQHQYIDGLFPALPGALDQALSLLSLVAAKILYFVGLRPSYSDLSLPLLLVRAAPGLILLPGLIWGVVCAGWRLRLFLLLFILPMMLSVSQERYNLAIQPLLFFLGYLAITTTWRRLRAALPRNA